jgi:hypothetical protein
MAKMAIFGRNGQNGPFWGFLGLFWGPCRAFWDQISGWLHTSVCISSFWWLKNHSEPLPLGKKFRNFFQKNFLGTRNFSKSPGNFFREKNFFEKIFFAQKHFLWCFEPKKILKKNFLP